MEELNNLNLIHLLREEIEVKNKPILGICLGMQLTCWGEEGDIGGLGIIPGIVKKFRLKKIKFHILDLIMFLFLKTPYYLMESIIIIQIFILFTAIIIS